MRLTTYVYYLAARFLANLSMQTLLLVLGLALYDLTSNPFFLGVAGLMIFVPAILLVFVTGLAADRFSRPAILAITFGVVAICAGFYTFLEATDRMSPTLILATLAIIGVARAFFNPTLKALLTNVVPQEAIPTAIAFNTSLGKLATISGPVLGGLLYAIDPLWAYATVLVSFTGATIAALLIRNTAQQRNTTPLTPSDVISGFRAILADRILFGAMTLDLCAVLLGGVTALLPVYAHEILFVGPAETGLLRASIAFGTLCSAFFLIWRPLNNRAGLVMLVGIFGYGAAILVFSLSVNFWLSAAALAVAGAFDMISIYVRETLIQVRTADGLRGRVNAINSVFNSGANELGDFRAGSSAAVIGVVPAVVIGGACSMIVSIIWGFGYPELRKLQRSQDS